MKSDDTYIYWSYWRTIFQKSIKIHGSVGAAFKNIIDGNHGMWIEQKIILNEFKYMLSAYYPQYLQKFETLLLLK